MKFNKTVVVATIVGLLVAGVATAQKVSTLPLAPTPFDGTEGIYIFKAGQSFRSTVLEIAKQIVALTPGVNGQSPTVVDHLATWANTAGTLIKDSGVAITRVVQGPVSSTVGHVATFNNTAGNSVSDSGVALGTMAPENANNVLITGGAITGLSVLSGTVGTLTSGTYNSPTINNPTVTNGSFTNPTISTPTVSGGTFTTPTITTPTITNPTVSNGTFNTPSILSPTISAPTVNNGVFTTPTINGGSFFASRVTKAASYTVGSTSGSAECSSTFALTGGSNQTLTIPAGLASSCNIIVANETGHAWNISATGISSFFIWPAQLCRFVFNGAIWTSNCPYRYAKSGLNLFVGPAGSCNDTNDGLTADSVGQLCHVNTAIIRAQTSIDNLQGLTTVNLAVGAYTEAVFMAGQPPGGADQINIVGSGPSTIVTAPGGQAAFGVRDYGILTVSNLTIGCVNSVGVNATQFAVLDIHGVIFGSCDNGLIASAQNTGHVNCTGQVTISGNAAGFLFAGDGGIITCTVVVAFSIPVNMTTTFAEAVGVGAKIEASGMTFSNPGFVTGVRYIIAGLAEIDTGGGGVNFFPGSAPGVDTGVFPTGGYYH